METIKNIIAFVVFCMVVVLVGDTCWKGLEKLFDKIVDLFKKDAKTEDAKKDAKTEDAKKDAKPDEAKSEAAPAN